MSNLTPTPEPVQINASRALRMIQDAVKTRSPEYNYKQNLERFLQEEFSDAAKSCVYARNGEAYCLVGVALALEGVPVSVLEAIEAESDELDSDEDHDCEVEGCTSNGDHSTGISNPWLLDRLRVLSGFEFTPEAVDVLSVAQVYQDTSRTWGEAEAAAAKTKDQGYREPLPGGIPL